VLRVIPPRISRGNVGSEAAIAGPHGFVSSTSELRRAIAAQPLVNLRIKSSSDQRGAAPQTAVRLVTISCERRYSESAQWRVSALALPKRSSQALSVLATSSSEAL
jgi:hypothetical protein